jgi:hypothetical protein
MVMHEFSGGRGCGRCLVVLLLQVQLVVVLLH